MGEPDDLDELRRKLASSVTDETFQACVSAWEQEFEDNDADAGDGDAFLQFLWSSGVLDAEQVAALSGATHAGSDTVAAVHVDFGGPKLPEVAVAPPANVTPAGEPPAGATVELPPPSALDATQLQEGHAAELPLPPGLRRHTVLKKVGTGGMGSVYLARDANLRRKVALKQQDVRDLAELKQFTLEAQITAQLEHPHVVPVYAFEATADGRVAYTMKMVEGQTLEEVIEAAKLEPEPLAGLPARLELFLGVCTAIDYAHAKGVLHRDLKPANVMIGPFGELYVVDWGLAKLLGSAEERVESRPSSAGSAADSAPALSDIDVEDPATRTVAGTLKGTPLYMSPEQAIPKPEDVGPHSDQYALGLILYELVNLRRAYSGQLLRDVLAQARTGQLQPPKAELDPPVELSAIIAKATAFAPEARYPSVRALAKDVRRFLRNQETTALPDDMPRKVRRWLTRHPQQALGIGGALVLLIAISLVVGVAWQRVAVANARLRHERLAENQRQLLSRINTRAQDMDRDTLRYRGQTGAIARAASVSLQRAEPSQEPIYGTDAYGDPARRPPGMLESTHYGKPIHPRLPVYRWSPRSDPAVAERAVRQLVPLRHPMRDLFRGDGLDARGGGGRMDAATLSARIAGHAVPIEWVYVATESGAIVLFPGAQDMGWDAEFDPRDRSWYREAKAAFSERGHTRHLSRPYLDQMGQGLVVTFTQAVLDDEGVLLGFAAIDLGLDFISQTYLAATELPGFQRGFLLTRAGEVLLSSDAAISSTSEPDGTLVLAPFPHSDQLYRVLDERSGLLRHGDLALAWCRTHVGNVLVFEADAETLFAEAEEE